MPYNALIQSIALLIHQLCRPLVAKGLAILRLYILVARLAALSDSGKYGEIFCAVLVQLRRTLVISGGLKWSSCGWRVSHLEWAP